MGRGAFHRYQDYYLGQATSDPKKASNADVSAQPGQGYRKVVRPPRSRGWTKRNPWKLPGNTVFSTPTSDPKPDFAIALPAGAPHLGAVVLAGGAELLTRAANDVVQHDGNGKRARLPKGSKEARSLTRYDHHHHHEAPPLPKGAKEARSLTRKIKHLSRLGDDEWQDLLPKKANDLPRERYVLAASILLSGPANNAVGVESFLR